MRQIISITMIVMFGLPSGIAFADGGTVRLSERHVNYQITMFTSPTPVRAGTVDISVLVQDAASGEAVTDVPVEISLAAADKPQEIQSQPATTAAATNKLFRSAIFAIPHAGRWMVNATVGSGSNAARVGFDFEASEPLPQWLALWPWFLWPAAVVALFGVHLVLVQRRHEKTNVDLIAHTRR